MKAYKTVLLLSYICVASVSATLITPALPAIAHDYAVNQAQLSWVVSLFLIGYVIGQLVYGPLAKRFTALTALRSGLMLNLVGVVLCLTSVYTSSYSCLLVGRVLSALGSASGLACTFMLMHDMLDEKQYKHTMSFAVLAFTLGIGGAVLVGGMISQYAQWQWCFWFLLAYSLLMYLLTWVFHHMPNAETHPLHIKVIIKNYWHALCHFQLIRFAILVGFLSAFSYVYAAVAPLYAQQVLHLTAATYGYWNIVNMLGMFFGGLVSAYIMKKHCPKLLMRLGFIGLLPCWFGVVRHCFCTHTLVIIVFCDYGITLFFWWFFISIGILFCFARLCR